MITVISGKIGAGKSFDAVRRVRDHLAAGGCVCTNISLDYAQIGRAVGRRLSSKQIMKLSADDDPKTIPTGDRRGRGNRKTIVLLDEALNWFQSTDAKKDDPKKKEWGEWLRQSDKLGQNVWFIAQNFERAAKWIRELAQVSEEVFPMRDMRLFFFIPFTWVFPFFKRMYCVKRRDVRSGQMIGCEFHFYTRKVWDLYDTSETFGFVGAQSAYDSVRLYPPYKSPAPLLAIQGLGCLLCFVVTGLLLAF